MKLVGIMQDVHTLGDYIFSDGAKYLLVFSRIMFHVTVLVPRITWFLDFCNVC